VRGQHSGAAGAGIASAATPGGGAAAMSLAGVLWLPRLALCFMCEACMAASAPTGVRRLLPPALSHATHGAPTHHRHRTTRGRPRCA
jgi:hypothetical protein